MLSWGLILLGTLAWLGAAQPIQSDMEPRGILRGRRNRNPVDTTTTHLINKQPSGGENHKLQPECMLMAAYAKEGKMKGISIYDNPAKKQNQLVEEQPLEAQHKVNENTPEMVEEKNTPDTPVEIATQPEEEKNTSDIPEEKNTPETPEENATQPDEEKNTSDIPEEKNTPETPVENATQPDEEKNTPNISEENTSETPEENSARPEEGKSTPETPEDNSAELDGEKDTPETPEENATEHAEEKSMPETPEKEPTTIDELGPKAKADKDECSNAASASERKPKAPMAPTRHPSKKEEDDLEDQSVPRKGGRRGGSVYRNFFPIMFGGASPSRSRNTNDSEGEVNQGAVTAIANSFSKGRGAIASSSAVANGSPDVGQFRQSQYSRYRH